MRILSLCLLMFLVLIGCQPEETAPPPEPRTLLRDAATSIRNAETFRLYVAQSGAPYIVELVIGTVEFRHANAQYVTPDTLQANAKVVAGSITAEIDIFARGERQWFRLPGAAWVEGAFAVGFNPATLIAEDSGFETALNALQEIEYVGTATLEDGTPVYHLRGTATGESVSALVVGLIEATGLLPVEVYIHRETGYPARLIVQQPDTATEEHPEPTTWTIDVFDVNAPAELTPPDA